MRVLFPDGFDERAEAEMTARGYLSHTRVQADDGRTFALYFTDPVRLAQDLEGQRLFVEVGLIVLPEVTVAAIHEAVADLEARGYFDYLRPLKPDDRPWDI